MVSAERKLHRIRAVTLDGFILSFKRPLAKRNAWLDRVIIKADAIWIIALIILVGIFQFQQAVKPFLNGVLTFKPRAIGSTGKRHRVRNIEQIAVS